MCAQIAFFDSKCITMGLPVRSPLWGVPAGSSSDNPQWILQGKAWPPRSPQLADDMIPPSQKAPHGTMHVRTDCNRGIRAGIQARHLSVVRPALESFCHQQSNQGPEGSSERNSQNTHLQNTVEPRRKEGSMQREVWVQRSGLV